MSLRFRLVGMGLLAAMLSACLQSAPPPRPNDLPPGGIVLYGDSLVENAQNYYKLGVHLRMLGGTAPCDFFGRMNTDALQHPAVVVLAFTGNMLTPCTRVGGSRHDVYLAGLQVAKAKFPAARVFVVLPPPMRDSDNSDVVQAARDSGLATLDARTPLSIGGAFAVRLPCLPDEGPGRGCVNGQITVRSSDGVHFCDQGSCDVPYSSGSRRFADATSVAW